MKPHNYFIGFHGPSLQTVHIVCTFFDKYGSPRLWAIERGSGRMSKKDGKFWRENLPSSRTREEIDFHRWETAESAYQDFCNFHAGSVVLYNPYNPDQPFFNEEEE